MPKSTQNKDESDGKYTKPHPSLCFFTKEQGCRNWALWALDSRCGFQMQMSFCSAAVFKLKRTVGVVWKSLIIFHCFCGPTFRYALASFFKGVVCVCVSCKRHGLVWNKTSLRGCKLSRLFFPSRAGRTWERSWQSAAFYVCVVTSIVYHSSGLGPRQRLDCNMCILVFAHMLVQFRAKCSNLCILCNG